MQLQVTKLTCFKGTRINQILFANIITVPILSFGMMQGWLSPMMSVLQSPEGPSKVPFTSSDISWITSVMFITAVIFGVPMGYLTDKYGRKKMTLLTAFSMAMYWLIKLICIEPWAVILARAIAGIPCSACFIVLPIYLKEISDIDLRGAMGSLLMVNRTLGYLISYVCVDLLDINSMLWLGFLVPAIVFIIFLAMPETPEHLVKQGKQDEAREVLAWLRGVAPTDQTVEADIETIVRTEKQVKSDAKSAWSIILHDRPTFKAFIITLVFRVTQQFDGYLIILIYSGFIFEQASESISLNLSPNKQTMMIGVMQVVGATLAATVIEKTGRKPLLVTMSLAVGAGNFLLAAWFFMTSLGFWLPGWLPLLAMCLCIFADSAGFHPVQTIILTDMFNFQLRATVSSFANILAKISNFAQMKWFFSLSKLVGIPWTFVFYGSICSAAGIFAIVYFPETKLKTVDEIYAKLEKKKMGRNSNSKPRTVA